MDNLVDHQVNVTDTVIQSKQAAYSEVAEIDDAKEMAKQTALNVRQQASVAMMAQANMAQQGIMRLFM